MRKHSEQKAIKIMKAIITHIEYHLTSIDSGRRHISLCQKVLNVQQPSPKHSLPHSVSLPENNVQKTQPRSDLFAKYLKTNTSFSDQ